MVLLVLHTVFFFQMCFVSHFGQKHPLNGITIFILCVSTAPQILVKYDMHEGWRAIGWHIPEITPPKLKISFLLYILKTLHIL